MLADFIFVCVILLVAIAVCVTGYYSAKHCENLGVTFRDFYFGTPRYDRAAERYKKEKAKNKCKCQNDRGIKYICKKCLDKEVDEIIKEKPKVNDVLNPKFKIGQRIVTKQGVEGQVVLIFCTHPIYTYYCSMFPGADNGYEYNHCIDLNCGCLTDGKTISTLTALNKYLEDQLEECDDEA